MNAAQTEHLPTLTLSEADRERRIRIARLTARQARKYRTTLTVIDLADSDLRTASLADRLGITRATSRRYRKEAPNTIAQVETQLDAWTEALGSPAAMQPLKTLAPGARPASESIVAPYRETVLRLAAEEEGHQRIHAVIRKEGVTSSANAVYQYLLKVRHENALAGDDRSEDQPSDQAKGRPLRIGLIRVARGSIYRRLIQEIAAVKNCLRYPAISNGPMEGTHNKIKMVCRRGYGRAGLELLNALFALPWYSYDLDPTQQPYPEAA